MAVRVPLRYRLLLVILSPLVFTYLVYYTYRHGGGWRYIKQRSGYTKNLISNRVAWLHAASVGEVNAAVPLLELLFKQYPEVQWILTTNTVTGAQSVAQKFGNRVQHHYLPLDYRIAIRNFLKNVQPRCCLIMETELWPNLYSVCKQQKIPLAIINARLSRKTLDMPKCLRKIATFCLEQVYVILARGKQDQIGFIQLGADPDRLRVIGNIKYAANDARVKQAAVKFDRPFVLAASTHNDEELQLARMWQSLNIKSHLLVIAPRYPNRRQEVLEDLEKAGLKTAVRSQQDSVTSETDVYLVDTLGELAGFMADADIIFMGGSLVPRGGQNVLEPAKLGKAIITGPQSFTFAEDIEALLDADAIVCSNTIDELKNTIVELLQKPDRAKQLGNNAQRFMAERADVAERYLDEIKQLGWLEKDQKTTTVNTE
ncbi:MAG: 3-deoxy-D-manno-octulosonic acid transferase [Gammaproteobacteria bacterium]|nr:3-deoxy-D-manno-octulosonic acid transferase [Gammaproteobacteria bacterium]